MAKNIYVYSTICGSVSEEDYRLIESNLADSQIVQNIGINSVRKTSEMHIYHSVTEEGDATLVFRKIEDLRYWSYDIAGDTGPRMITKKRLEEIIQKAKQTISA